MKDVNVFDPNTTIVLPNQPTTSRQIVDFDEFTVHFQDNETIINLPQRLGKGYNRSIQLRDGLTIEIIQVQLAEVMYLKRNHKKNFPLVAHFYLTGNSVVETFKTKEIEPKYTELAGRNYLYHLPNLSELEQWPCDTEIKLVSVYAPVDYFSCFYQSENFAPSLINQLITGDRDLKFHLSLGKNTLKVTEILQQIYQCPYQGIIKQIYLESKALELFAWQFNCMDATKSEKKASQLKKDDLERVKYAQEILVKQVLDPPSLAQLSRQVSLNERKLKQGFRQLFGTTVFGYLYNYRMQQAQQLLADNNLSVAQVAQRVGYTNPEAFCMAFRRKFGVSPKTHQKTIFYK
ncbi:regulatory protein; PcrR [Synechocystis sp. PCC 6803]|uniref:Regulatory protein PcrR n=1 Tax=Synechocystis sp. (strain ATCC 27184 / PCC 6803 / Kazusa) TaxID=1111708 RepID=P72600_SYNY3|nr:MULTISPECIES: AraC family transcriptional regulator [unclassified Synechocystis]BAM50297.1 regulatory protein PcrR [Synechocystis sp. PCC 6803] [Bacillus subtilis BEST7613]AGF50289.1 regulatory protein PcrR [Synechocystis sp. PCC 6803]ALJ66390.1 transcriptional regulator [Synechocystis sp. PCC 6803]AVP88236.1 AraC family transcriptional regulator [Synechocystis sp. IPPAS B-1465]MBD2619613.1 helix-turn-helix transcriptional regulator [Synechocystis sp. FACHB-898]